MSARRARPASATPSSRTTTIRGVVVIVFFRSATFSAGKLRTQTGEKVAFAGPILVRSDEHVVLTGAFERHPKFGLQFRATALVHDLDLDAQGLAHYLANHPDVSGIGPARAQKIAQAFAHRFDEALERCPEEIARVAGVPLEVILDLREVWMKTAAVNAAMTWLAAYGLSHHQVTTLVEEYGNNIVPLLKEDPYIVAGAVRGFGFKRLDAVARKLGTPKDHPSRLKAGVLHCVTQAVDDGDCWIEFERLIEAANALLVLDTLDSRAQIEAALDALIEEQKVACTSIGGRFLVARQRLYEMECDLSRWFAAGRAPSSRLDGHDVAELVADLPTELNTSQREAVEMALSHARCVISGAAGSGKTYVIGVLARLLQSVGLCVTLAAPTGKAAKRLQQVVGQDAVTIHRLLEFNGKVFKRGRDEPLVTDVVIIDEVSMVDVPLAWALLDALEPETTLILVGDHNQLPPVGPGNILRDLIERRPVPVHVLQDVVRQAGVLRANSLAILQGEVRRTSEQEENGRRPWYVVDQFADVMAAQRFVCDLFENVLVERLGFDLLGEVQVLTPQRKGPLGVHALNVLLQRVIQKKLFGVQVEPVPEGRRPEFLVGDKVIQTRNNYRLGVMNGAIGVVVQVGAQRGDLIVQFEGGPVHYSADTTYASDLSHAFACTIHKAQGSEFPCVVAVVHKAHSFMHHRNLFYTAVTRAQEVAIVVGDRWGQRHCAEKEQIEQRKTFLSVLDLAPPDELSAPARGGPAGHLVHGASAG